MANVHRPTKLEPCRNLSNKFRPCLGFILVKPLRTYTKLLANRFLYITPPNNFISIKQKGCFLKVFPAPSKPPTVNFRKSLRPLPKAQLCMQHQTRPFIIPAGPISKPSLRPKLTSIPSSKSDLSLLKIARSKKFTPLYGATQIPLDQY